MLGDVAQPSPFVDPAHQAAGLAIAAAVARKTGKRRQQPIGEARQPVRRPGLERPEVELDPDHGCGGVEMRPTVDAAFEDAHRPARGHGGFVVRAAGGTFGDDAGLHRKLPKLGRPCGGLRRIPSTPLAARGSRPPGTTDVAQRCSAR